MSAGVTLSFEGSYKTGLIPWGLYSETNFSSWYLVLAERVISPLSFCLHRVDTQESLVFDFQLKYRSHRAFVDGRLYWRSVARREVVLYHKMKQQKNLIMELEIPVLKSPLATFLWSFFSSVSHFPMIFCLPFLLLSLLLSPQSSSLLNNFRILFFSLLHCLLLEYVFISLSLP